MQQVGAIARRGDLPHFSGARREEPLLDARGREKIHLLCRVPSDINLVEVVGLLRRHPDKAEKNAVLLTTLNLA